MVNADEHAQLRAEVGQRLADLCQWAASLRADQLPPRVLSQAALILGITSPPCCQRRKSPSCARITSN